MKHIEDPHKHFYTVDGTVLKGSEDFLNYLSKVDPEAFSTHVNEEKNDFANWVEDVWNEKTLAKKIRKTKTPQELTEILQKFTKKKTSPSKQKKQKIISMIKEAHE